MKEEVLTYLKQEPRFRQRSAKWRGIADLLIKKYNLDIDRRKLADVIADGSTADRSWRMALKENKDLRGTDYNDKDILEEQAQINLGYTPNYHEDVRKLKTLTN